MKSILGKKANSTKSHFVKSVYNVVKHIPKGKVATYKQIAELAGAPGAYRAVGTVMKNNPDTRVVPCHRVVGSDGKMHGYAFGKGTKSKIKLLKKEGIIFNGDRVDLREYEWKV